METNNIVEEARELSGILFHKGYGKQAQIIDKLLAHIEQEPKWVSVEDRLPEYGEYLVSPIPNGDLNIITANYLPSKKVWTQDFYNGYDYEDMNVKVTHWMPLPSPPQGIDK